MSNSRFKKVPCDNCNGKGVTEYEYVNEEKMECYMKLEKCRVCNGTGQVDEEIEDNCSYCHDSGYVGMLPCPSCNSAELG